MSATVTVDYGDGMVTTWTMSKFMAIGVAADLDREHGEGHTSDHPHITCPVCRMTSYNPHDIEHGYCGNCHAYTGTVNP